MEKASRAAVCGAVAGDALALPCGCGTILTFLCVVAAHPGSIGNTNPFAPRGKLRLHGSHMPCAASGVVVQGERRFGVAVR